MRKFIAYTEQFFASLFSYGRPEQQGIVLIVAVTAAVLLLLSLRPHRQPDADWLAAADRRHDSLRTAYFQQRRSLYRQDTVRTFSRPTRPYSGGKPTVYIELNTADSARLTTVRGIGPTIARSIVRTLGRLGGFVRKSQLREAWGITDENFDAIAAQFFIDTAAIQKINLNFASPNALRSHPYFTASMVERIVRGRETKGGWKALKELTDNDILLPDEAKKIAAYVAF
jgi:DNA uptake protein ComE-like DNA-binding protein